MEKRKEDLENERDELIREKNKSDKNILELKNSLWKTELHENELSSEVEALKKEREQYLENNDSFAVSMFHIICETGWHFDGSRYGKNGGYLSLLTEKPS